MDRPIAVKYYAYKFFARVSRFSTKSEKMLFYSEILCLTQKPRPPMSFLGKFFMLDPLPRSPTSHRQACTLRRAAGTRPRPKAEVVHACRSITAGGTFMHPALCTLAGVVYGKRHLHAPRVSRVSESVCLSVIQTGFRPKNVIYTCRGSLWEEPLGCGISKFPPKFPKFWF